MSAPTNISTAVLHTSKVLKLDETSPDEAAKLFQALANAAPMPEAVALDHLMDDDARPSA